MVPLRQVAVTGGPVGRRSELHPVHTAATLQSVVCVTDGVLPPEKLLQPGHVDQTLHILVIVHARAERLLVRLTLKSLLLDGARRQKSVDEAGFLLSVSPDAGHGPVVVVVSWSSLAGLQSGSNITSRLAPIRFRPQPPALLLSMRMNSGGETSP